VTRVVLTASLAGALLVPFAGPAGAHASIEATTPADGELLDSPPSEVRLLFTEPPDISLTVIGLIDAAGAEMPTGDPEGVPGTDLEVRVPLEELRDGVYTVAWRTVSSADGHVSSGSFSFGVGVSPEDVPPPAADMGTTTPPPSALSIIGRWLLYVGLVILFASALTGLVAFGTSLVANPRVLAIAWILAVAGVVAMTAAERSTVGVPLGTLLASEVGTAYLRLAVAVGIAGLGAVAVGLRPSRIALMALGAGAALAMLARAAGGHAGGSPPAIAVQWLHLIGVGAWIGGLTWLILGLRRGLQAERVRRFSNLAAIGLVIVFASGVLRASDELGGFAWFLDAFDTGYGTALVAKLALVAPLVALGALNRFRNVPAYHPNGPRPLARTVSGELAIAGGVFAITALLTGLPPQGTPEGTVAPPLRSLAVVGSDFATTTTVTLRISPGTVGPNTFVATVGDYDTGEPVDARRVSLSFGVQGRPEVAGQIELEPQPDRTWQADGTTLSIDDVWEVTVLVEGAADSTEVPLTVIPRSAGQEVAVSRVEGQPDVYTISLADGVQLQCYVDPDEPGTSQFHLTAFDASGAELALEDAFLVAQRPDGGIETPELTRFSPGHFVANLELTAGVWTFDASTITSEGETIGVAFAQAVGG
jgi:copper transport protein